MYFCCLQELNPTNMGKNQLTLLLKQVWILQKFLWKIVHETAAATGELVGNRIVDKIVKQKPISDVKPKRFSTIKLSDQKKDWGEWLIK